jgi:hypothetical protein
VSRGEYFEPTIPYVTHRENADPSPRPPTLYIASLTLKGIEKLSEKQSEKQKPPGVMPAGSILQHPIFDQMNIFTNNTVMTRPTNNSAI